MRELFQMDGMRARREIRKLAFNEKVDSQVRLRALVEILDRGWGRPITPTAISGPDGAPLRGAPRDAAEELQIAQRIAFILLATRPRPPSDGGSHS